MLLVSTMLSISTLGGNKFSDLFAALSIPRVLNIENLQLHMLTDLTHQRLNCGIFHMASTIYTLCRLSCYVITFVTSKKTYFLCRLLQQKLALTTMFSDRNLYVLRSQRKDKMINEQPGAWSFADTFRTAEKTNLISLWSDDSLNASLWRHIRCFRISKIVTSLLSVCKVLYHSM